MENYEKQLIETNNLIIEAGMYNDFCMFAAGLKELNNDRILEMITYFESEEEYESCRVLTDKVKHT